MKNAAIRRALPLLASLALLGIGSNLVASLIGIEMSRQDFPEWTSGLIAAGFALGGLLGANMAPRVVERAGHLHTFAAFAAILACVVLAHALTEVPVIWMALRLATGLLYYGLVLVAESWLNELASDRNRGRLLSIYMVVFWGSGAVGQLLLNLAEEGTTYVLIVAGMIMTLSVVPVSLFAHAESAEDGHEAMPLSNLLRSKPLPVFGAFCAGVTVGTYYALGALYGEEQGFSTGEISMFMASVIAGALFLQWPIGWLSDQINRKHVISLSAFAAAGSALAIPRIEDAALLMPMAFIFGGVGFSLYSLNLALVGDRTLPSQAVGISRSFLTVFAMGAAAGPLLAGALLVEIGSAAIFLLPAFATAVLALVSVISPAAPDIVKRVFVSVPMGSLRSSALDPRRSARHESVD